MSEGGREGGRGKASGSPCLNEWISLPLFLLLTPVWEALVFQDVRVRDCIRMQLGRQPQLVGVAVSCSADKTREDQGSETLDAPCARLSTRALTNDELDAVRVLLLEGKQELGEANVTSALVLRERCSLSQDCNTGSRGGGSQSPANRRTCESPPKTKIASGRLNLSLVLVFSSSHSSTAEAAIYRSK